MNAIARVVSAPFEFGAQMLWALSDHLARLIAWAVVVTFAAVWIGCPLTWRLIPFCLAINITGALLYPEQGDIYVPPSVRIGAIAVLAIGVWRFA